MIIISDTSIISGLVIVDKVDILTKLFGKIIVPQAVKSELLLLEAYKNKIKQFFEKEQIGVLKPTNKSFYNELFQILDKGEAEAITLAVELKADLLLVDEKKGRIIAKQLEIMITGLLGILLLAKQQNIISSVKQIMDKLKSEAGFWIGENLYDKVLHEAREN